MSTIKEDRYEKIQRTGEDSTRYPMLLSGLPKAIVLHMTTFSNKNLDQEMYYIDLHSRKLSICRWMMYFDTSNTEHDLEHKMVSI